MFGNDVITRCPCCKELIVENIGLTKYYNYKGTEVRVVNHCDKDFITADFPMDLFAGRYFIPEVLVGWKNIVIDTCLEHMEEAYKLDEEQSVLYLLDKLREKCDVVDEYRAEFTEMLQAALVRLQSITGIPLTEEVYDDLEDEGHVVAW